ncbi:hypothetical protein [Campylobacter porcelli]|uniref:hypothetical protein n=2 Tax=Campylobacteraceae TaxID=72294 RepID=UPI000A330FD9|nr:hypothetical protein [Campylobacter sp. P0078]
MLFINAKKNGKFPVIQQGFKPIVGFSSNENFFKDFNNVLLFGDHTLSLYKPTTPFFIASDGIKILKLINTNSNFFKNLLFKNMPKSEGYKRHFGIVKNIKTKIPTDLKEQEAIGEFFRKIDEILELSQNRISKLENIKKYLLNKMFV